MPKPIERIAANMDAELMAQLRREAYTRGWTVRAVIEEAVKLWLEVTKVDKG